MILKKTFINLSKISSKLEKKLKEFEVFVSLNDQGLIKARKIHSFTTKEELIKLYEIATTCPEKANVVEIGSYLGASTSYIAAGLSNKKAYIYCIDTWKNETMPDGKRDTYKEFLENLSKTQTQVIKIRKKSSQVHKSELPLSIDFAFIDGDHSFCSVSSDVQLVESLMAKNSVIAFHDAIYFKGVSLVIGTVLRSGNWRLEGQVNNLVWLRKYKFQQ
jgi:predicted O-methyltransferase YrrM